jgi:tRNA1Val (adenine37-N6)-methyltransferase
MDTAKTETCESILDGRLRVFQPADGYRFSIDSILLARFVSVREGDRVLELGAGCGVISIAIAALYRPSKIIAVEIQPGIAAMIRRSAAINEMQSVIHAIEGDLRSLADPEIAASGFDVVVANPPYRAKNSGRESPDEGRRVARSETAATLEDFIAAAALHLRDGGRAAFVFCAERFAELISVLRAHRLEPKRIRFVHPAISKPATTVLIETRKGGGTEVTIEPPLIEPQ